MVEHDTNIENKMFDRVVEDYMARICEVEIEIYKSRVLRMDTPTQVYFNSSPLKNVFARVMTVGRLQGKAISITQLAHKLLVSRQAISTMVQECLSEGWIKLVEIRGREKCYYATSLLVAETYKYVKFVYELNDTNLVNLYHLIRELSDIHPDYTYEYTAVNKFGEAIKKDEDKI